MMSTCFSALGVLRVLQGDVSVRFSFMPPSSDAFSADVSFNLGIGSRFKDVAYFEFVNDLAEKVTPLGGMKSRPHQACRGGIQFYFNDGSHRGREVTSTSQIHRLKSPGSCVRRHAATAGPDSRCLARILTMKPPDPRTTVDTRSLKAYSLSILVRIEGTC